MATIQNERDKLLQAAAVRFIPPFVDPDLIPGYNDALEDISELQDTVGHLLNTSANFAIRASAMAFTGAAVATSPTSITLTAVRGPGLDDGTVAWSVVTGVATVSPLTGEATSVAGSSVTGQSVTIRARLTADGKTYDAFVTLSRFGAIAAEDQIDLNTQVTGALASGNVTGLGALALLNVVDLNTQTVGALNGQTQVTNLGTLAYANAIAANQIGAGTLAAGVIYAGNIEANQIDSRGLTIRTPAGQVILDASRKLETQDLVDAGVFATLNSIGYGSSLLTGFGTLAPLNSVSLGGSQVTGNLPNSRVTGLGNLATQNTVNLSTQVTGALANSSVSGLGALALLNVVNLNTQVTGALNGQTQVTNLGNLAYVNGLAANQIGAGTLAAGVIYAGTINASQVTAGTISGSVVLSGNYFYSGSGVAFLGASGSDYGLAVDVSKRVHIEWPIDGTTGDQIAMTGRKFWMNIGGTGAVEVEIGARIP